MSNAKFEVGTLSQRIMGDMWRDVTHAGITDETDFHVFIALPAWWRENSGLNPRCGWDMDSCILVIIWDIEISSVLSWLLGARYRARRAAFMIE